MSGHDEYLAPYPHIILDDGRLSLGAPLLDHGDVGTLISVVTVEDSAVWPHHDIVSYGYVTWHFAVDAQPGIISYADADTGAKLGSMLYVNIFATMFENMSTTPPA